MLSHMELALLVKPHGGLHSVNKETSVENLIFSERRVNLLKAHVLQLKRQGQVQLLSDLQVYGEALEYKIKLIHAFTCAGILPSQYYHFCRLASLGTVGKRYTDSVYKSKGDIAAIESCAEASMMEAIDEIQSQPRNMRLMERNKEPIAEDVTRLRKLNQRLKKVSCPREDLALPLVYTGGLSKPLTILDSLSNKDNMSLREIQTPHKLTNEQENNKDIVRDNTRSLEIIESRQADQLKAQEAEIMRQKESMEDYVKYIEELFLSIKTSHKEFMRDLYHKIDLPLKDLTAHYYHLKASNSSLEILESYIYEMRDNQQLKQISEKDSESLLDVFNEISSKSTKMNESHITS
uniref:Uncharacterized protein n=1 Tax=Amphimedon queenslandica TaxID=400682 RepID=A0A1X7UVZ9_AMPQE